MSIAESTAHAEHTDHPASAAQCVPSRGEQDFRRARIAPYRMPGAECLQRNKVDWGLRARDAVLVLHDMQNFWLDFYQQPEPLIRALRQLRDLCDVIGVPVVMTSAQRPQHPAERGLSRDLWGPGIGGADYHARDTQFVQALQMRPHDHHIVKEKYSAFFNTPLQDVLARTGRRQIVLCGVFAHHGVMLTAADAFMRNYQVFMPVDGVADYCLDDHLLAVNYVAQMCGKIMLLADVEQALRADARTYVKGSE